MGVAVVIFVASFAVAIAGAAFVWAVAIFIFHSH
jgi:hypothetical protein